MCELSRRWDTKIAKFRLLTFQCSGGRTSVCPDNRQAKWLTSKPAKLAPFYVGANTLAGEHAESLRIPVRMWRPTAAREALRFSPLV